MLTTTKSHLQVRAYCLSQAIRHSSRAAKYRRLRKTYAYAHAAGMAKAYLKGYGQDFWIMRWD